jgi:GNAT superfamily N-acetyltransferase
MTAHAGDYVIAPGEPGEAGCDAMTFPAYRHLLTLAPGTRHLDRGDTRVIQPLAVVARSHGEPVALGLAELPVSDEQTPEVLSLFVNAPHRRRGLATALVACLEEEVRRRGLHELQAVYMTGTASVDIVERMFAGRGWEAPTVRAITVKFTPEEAATTPWYGRIPLPRGSEVFPWKEMTRADRQALFDSNVRDPWIPQGLCPWRHDFAGFDPVSSIGLRYRGEVVGWVINHQVDAHTVRFTCSFMRKDLSGHARILPLYTASIDRLRGTACRLCTFITPVVYTGMVEFVRTRCAKWVTFVGETRGMRKALP